MSARGRATQEFVPIQEVRDGILILKDGSMRAILITSSVNFALKSADNQASILYQFQNFFNSLDFSIQIAIQSRRLDIRPYLALLEERYQTQVSDLMRIQTRSYIEFIRGLSESTNIMLKSFFIVIPYIPPIISSSKNALASILKRRGRAETVAAQTFEEHRGQLDQRVAVVEQGLARVGLRTAPLGTEEVIELFYKIFNPTETETAIKVS